MFKSYESLFVFLYFKYNFTTIFIYFYMDLYKVSRKNFVSTLILKFSDHSTFHQLQLENSS